MTAENNPPINLDDFDEILKQLLIENPNLESEVLERIRTRWKQAESPDEQIVRRNTPKP